MPGNGIDLEANTNNQTIDAIKIYNNKFYELEGKAAVEVFRGIQTVEIYNNEINGDILCFDAKTEISIYNNNIKNGVIRFYKDEFLQSLGNYMKKAIIRNNNLYNTYFDINDVQYIDLNNNQIEEGYIIVNSCNGQISDNNITNQQKTDFAYKYAAKTEGNTYILKVLNNQANGEFNNLEIIQKIDSLIIKRE